MRRAQGGERAGASLGVFIFFKVRSAVAPSPVLVQRCCRGFGCRGEGEGGGRERLRFFVKTVRRVGRKARGHEKERKGRKSSSRGFSPPYVAVVCTVYVMSKNTRGEGGVGERHPSHRVPFIF